MMSAVILRGARLYIAMILMATTSAGAPLHSDQQFDVMQGKRVHLEKIHISGLHKVYFGWKPKVF